jgi:CRISPR/Cas system-associated exonuclease Cas4 (RecB family)
VAENEILLFELYKVYRELNKSAESFDEFYFWGDMLISDFDDIDKYMADASVLFLNIKDFKDIDIHFSDIDPEQAQIIKRFWKNFEPEKPSPEKTDFKFLWSVLHDLYSGFRKSLRSSNLGYEGMIARDVAEKYLDRIKPELKWDQVHFIGFNALNKCERTLMLQLQKDGLAKFYWDYDNSYIKGGKLNSAGLFLTVNFRSFRNDMPTDWNFDTLLSSDRNDISRNVIETTSDIAQVKLVPYLIDRLHGISTENAHHTAVILANEDLLVPLMTSLPENKGDVNITMGFPLKMTAVYSLIRHILDFQRGLTSENGTVYTDYRVVFDILKHELIGSYLDEDDKKIIGEILGRNLARVPYDLLCRTGNLKTIFRRAADPAQLSDHIRDILSIVSATNVIDEGTEKDTGMQRSLRNEFIYRVLLSVNRLDTIIGSPEIRLKTETYIRILDKILRNQSVPFSGEPLSGIQIMGILETRALDFKNIIMLSVNEGILPAVSAGSSFIPFSIREAFGLPSINHQESIYAYHFFRLLHRTENVTFIYNSDSDGLNTGEMSRFLIQMKYEHILNPDIQTPDFDIRTPVSIGPEIRRTTELNNRLFSLYLNEGSKFTLSPTAINTWLNCRMRFYYRYVSRIKEPEIISPEIDHAVFGQILHGVMKNIYEDCKEKEISVNYLDSLIKSESHLQSAIDRAISENYSCSGLKPQSGNDLIIKDILFVYLHRILNFDRGTAPFSIIDLEKPFHFDLLFELNGENKKIRTGGNIDRIDRVSGKTRVVDYKTGEVARKISSIRDLFADDRDKEPDGWLQTLLYCEAYISENQGVVVRPSIYKVKEYYKDQFSDTLVIKKEKDPEIPVEDYQRVRSEFLEGLKALMITIFSPGEPFRMTAKTSKCEYCPYKALCQR